MFMKILQETKMNKVQGFSSIDVFTFCGEYVSFISLINNSAMGLGRAEVVK